jgi:phosphoribosylglycinamide formyltransferase-1
MRILGSAITDKFSTKMINLHPSLLPEYPGLNTHQKVLSNNDNNHGVSIHYVSAELDGGPLIAQGIIKVKNNEDEGDLVDRIHKVEHLLLPEIVNEICMGNINLDRGKVVFKSIKFLDKGIIRKHYDI